MNGNTPVPAPIIIWNPFVFPFNLKPLPYGPDKVKLFYAHEDNKNLVNTPYLYYLTQNVRVELLIAT